MPPMKDDDKDPRDARTKIYNAVSKWQKASVQLTQVKIDLENLLDKEFDEHEKKDERYAQLFESVQFIFKNIEEHYTPIKESRIPTWINFKNALITASITVIVTIANNLEPITQFIVNFFKG
jgi:hypothetical protein